MTGNRAGFTLIEMMMAILLTMLVFAITIPFFRMQTKALDGGAGRLDALQNARYAQSAIDRELRLAGGAPGQPIIVQAAPFAVTFNVDLVTTVRTIPTRPTTTRAPTRCRRQLGAGARQATADVDGHVPDQGLLRWQRLHQPRRDHLVLPVSRRDDRPE